MRSHRLAVLADVHGNVWALEAVLADIRRRGADEVIDLGDVLYGPLDPAGTAELHRGAGITAVRGNQDRVLGEPLSAAPNPTMSFVHDVLPPDQLAWVAGLPVRLDREDLRFCHGTPDHDDVYLLETVSATGVSLKAEKEIEALLGPDPAEVTFCGHSHVPRVVAVGSRLVVNPGSVGLPAYDHDAPWPHVMEAGSPHARYALLSRGVEGWHIEQVLVPYPWKEAAARARRNGRPDWAEWIETGRARWPERHA
jgi:putative phosphoesterase